MQGTNQSRILPETHFIILDDVEIMQRGYDLATIINGAVQGILIKQDFYQFVDKKDFYNSVATKKIK
jgi:hypothetical protein